MSTLITSMQVKHLQARAIRAQQILANKVWESVGATEPASIKAARKLVKRWDAKDTRTKDRALAAVRTRIQKVQTAILFNTAKALPLVEKLEAEARRA